MSTENTAAEEQMPDINSDADIPGRHHLSNPEEEQEAADKAEAELQEQKDKYLRLFAEFDNYKRRTAKERIDLISTAGKDFAVSMLEVADDMDRAEKQIEASEDVAQIKEGIRLVFQKLRSSLAQKGITPVESAGKDFDTEQHEAVTEIEAGAEKAGKVVDEIQKGYTMNGKLIRFAKVVVGK